MKRLYVYLLVSIFYLGMFPPLPRFLLSLAYKISFTIFLLFIIGLILFIFLKQGRFKVYVKKEFYLISILVFLFLLLWTFLGILNLNDTYMLFKDFLFFFYPFLFGLALSFFPVEKLRSYFDVIVNLAVAFSFVQLVILITMAVMFRVTPENFEYFRFLYRSVGLIYTTYSLPLVWTIYLFFARKIFSWKSVILLFGILSSLGRIEVLFVLVVLAIILYYKFFKLNIKLASILLITCSSFIPFIYALKAVSTDYYLEENTSNRWRMIEIQSYYNEIKFGRINEKEILLGKGLGARIQTLEPLHMFGGEIHYDIGKFHNLYLFVLVKMGLIGLILLFLFIYLLLYIASKQDLVLFSYILYYFFLKANVFGVFSMSLDPSLGIALYLLFYRDFHSNLKTEV